MTKPRYLVPLLLLLATQPATAAKEGGGWVDGKPNYYPITPALTVNLNEFGISFAQIKLQLMTQEVATIEAVEINKPAVIDALITVISSKDRETMNSIQGRKKVQEEMKLKIQQVLEQLAHITPGESVGKGESAKEIKSIEQVLITDFVVQ